METSQEEESVSDLQFKLKEKIRELEEAQRNNSKLSNEITKLTRFNKDLISQIDLTNSKLHVLLGVCEGRADKSIQTESSIDNTKRCTYCQSAAVSKENPSQNQSDNAVYNQENCKQLKAADWAKIAQEVVDSNDYIFEPTSKTYYSQSSGWYYYPNEKLFFDPKSKNYYTFNQETKSYDQYLVETADESKVSKKDKKNKAEQESEEGELSSSSCESSPKRNDKSSRKKGSKFDMEDVDSYDSDINDDESNISCLRLIVRESESLKLGSLLLITITGALIGNSPVCDLVITDPSVSRKHARISYDQKKRCYLIADCSSKHGVFLNGNRLKGDETRVIKHGDILKLAKTEFLLHHHYGKEVTCNGCEPGCVQADLIVCGRLAKDDEEDIVIVEDRHTALKKLKKRYGVSWDNENLVNLPQNYNDRAKKRRLEKGSDNPYEKTGEGTSLDKPLTQENKGFKMLQKLGWKKGSGVGKSASGDTQPVPLVSSEGRTGLGFHS
ncbi:angiogenic factor with G patch and FHA domains 1 [Tetranychus urticae]|uniref:Angiogenic factor with G patch and FHA domains 1 n=1 Tax=Tetranychus urticae TaxID=32264 RepID=T1JWS7_TETUR|nr:angiogenic factor with G patch and FHA domains 1 [Tetranychus urticae]